MDRYIILIACGTALFFLLLGIADVMLMLVDRMLIPAGGKCDLGEVVLTLKDKDTAEMQLRAFLWQFKSRSCSGKITVIARDRESYTIAGKILRKYPNIGLLYRRDLNYNI